VTLASLFQIDNCTDVINYGLDLEIFPHNKSRAEVGKSQFLITLDTSQVEVELNSHF
jgi:hypothetical protein